jgi:hypothetical protein
MRQQGLDAVRVGHRRQGLEQVVQVGARLEAIGLRRFHQGVEHRTGLGTARAATEQPGLAPDGKRPDRVLGQVVVELEVAVLQERDQDRPLLAGVLDRLAEQALGQYLAGLVVEPGLDLIQDRLRLFQPHCMAVLWGGAADPALDLVQLADQGHERMCGPGLGPAVGRLDRLSAHVRPAAHVAPDAGFLRQRVIARIAIRLQVEPVFRWRAPPSGNRKSTGTSPPRLGAYWNQITGLPGGPPR